MNTFGFYSQELDLKIKFRSLSIAQCENFVEKFEDASTSEYIFNVLHACVANIDSEVRPVLARLDPEQADHTLLGLYNGCIMLNPILDVRSWSSMMYAFNILHNKKEADLLPDENYFLPPDPETAHHTAEKPKTKTEKKESKPFTINKATLTSLPRYLKQHLIGQDEPIDQIFKALKRHQTGLGEDEGPIATFMFAGASGVGKTYLAKLLNEYLFGKEEPLARINCGEFQHKHENQRLLGSPPGYVGHDDGGFFASLFRRGRVGVLLLDEVEKAHPDFWDTFLTIYDEGYLEDSKGTFLDFRNTIIIMTSNLGNKKISDEAYKGVAGFTSANISGDFKSKTPPKRAMVERITLEEVRKAFSVEFLNRIDEIIVFNHLFGPDWAKIAELEFKHVHNKLMKKEMNLEWTPAAIDLLVNNSGVAVEGARGMSKTRKNMLEDPIADLLYSTKTVKGKTVKVDVVDDKFVVE